MILQRNPNAWSCLPTSFAMVLNEPVEWFINEIGHDGSAEPYPQPGIKIGFHVQECIDAVWRVGYTCTPIELMPTLTPYENGPIQEVRYADHWRRFKEYLDKNKGVICGVVHDRKIAGHAVAWDGKQIYDSRGYVYAMGDRDFSPSSLWILKCRTT